MDSLTRPVVARVSAVQGLWTKYGQNTAKYGQDQKAKKESFMVNVKSFIHLKPGSGSPRDRDKRGAGSDDNDKRSDEVEMRRKTASVARDVGAAGADRADREEKTKSPDSSLHGRIHNKADTTAPIPQKTHRNAAHNLTDYIMGSRYCYGCVKFAVDAPGTPEETGWCQRDLDDDDEYEYEFRMIPTHAMVRQCPRVRSGEWSVGP